MEESLCSDIGTQEKLLMYSSAHVIGGHGCSRERAHHLFSGIKALHKPSMPRPSAGFPFCQYWYQMLAFTSGDDT